jgi:hypothetical protein
MWKVGFTVIQHYNIESSGNVTPDLEVTEAIS